MKPDTFSYRSGSDGHSTALPMSSTTEGSGDAIREDDELDLEDEDQTNGDEVDELEDSTEAHDYPDDGPLSVTRQRSAVGLENGNASGETSADGDNDYPPRRPRKDDDTGSIPDDSPSVQVSSSFLMLVLASL